MMMIDDEDDEEERQRSVLEQVFGPSISDEDNHCDGRSDSDSDMEEQHQRTVLEQVFGPSISDEDNACDSRSDSDSDMEEQHQRTVLEQVFGHSSDEDDEARSDFDSDFESNSDNCKEKKNWEPIEEVKGLWMLRNFLSNHQQSRLLSSIESEKWFTQPSINQAMRFGYQNLPHWAIKLSNSIHRSCCSDSSFFPPNLLQREPLFDQMIVNFYQPGEGISPHVDLLRFEDAIAIVSLESSCVMHFSLESESVPVLLTPGSLVIMFGDARYLWSHEINRKPGFQSWQGELLNQTTRTSVTLRKLCSSAAPI